MGFLYKKNVGRQARANERTMYREKTPFLSKNIHLIQRTLETISFLFVVFKNYKIEVLMCIE